MYIVHFPFKLFNNNFWIYEFSIKAIFGVIHFRLEFDGVAFINVAVCFPDEGRRSKLYLVAVMDVPFFISAAVVGLAISDKRNYSAEDGIDRAICSFRGNSGYFAEPKFRGILIRPNPRKWKNAWNSALSSKKKGANSRNSVPSHSLEEKTTPRREGGGRKRAILIEA